MLTQWLQAFKQAALRRKEAVTLHFYDMVMGSTQGEGSVQPLGTGNFHVGIEINGGNFCHTLCEALGVSIPPWILRLSSAEVLGQNLPAEKGRRGRGSAIIIAAQALDQFVDSAAWSIRAKKVTRRLAWLRHLETLLAFLGGGIWMAGYWPSSAPRTGYLTFTAGMDP
eukprot:g25786.t1